MQLREIAHSRTGDKGDLSTVSLIVYEMKDYVLIKEQVTEERVNELFSSMIEGPVVRYEIPSIGALNFVLHHALGGGVTRSLRLDKHGKTLGSYLLEMEVSNKEEV